jgi:hypothetical protein
MSEPADGREEAWQRAVGRVAALAADMSALGRDQAALLDRLAVALADPGERGLALDLLGFLGTDYTVALTGRLVAVSLSHRDALKVRQVLGRVPAGDAVRVVPPAVWSQLAETSDDDAYRRLAELLQHLGLAEALGQLCARAAASGDPDVREVGADFAG